MFIIIIRVRVFIISGVFFMVYLLHDVYCFTGIGFVMSIFKCQHFISHTFEYFSRFNKFAYVFWLFFWLLSLILWLVDKRHTQPNNIN